MLTPEEQALKLTRMPACRQKPDTFSQGLAGFFNIGITPYDLFSLNEKTCTLQHCIPYKAA